MLLARGGSWGGAVLPHPFLQLQCCIQRSLEGESDRVQAEHDDFLARLRRTCAASCTSALFSTLLSQYDFNTATCSGASSLVAARLRRNATHTYTYGGPSCSWASARSASGLLLIAPAESWGHALQAWNQIHLEHGGSQLS